MLWALDVFPSNSWNNIRLREKSGVSWVQLSSCLKMLWHTREARDVKLHTLFFSEWAYIYIDIVTDTETEIHICPLTGLCLLHSDQCQAWLNYVVIPLFLTIQGNQPYVWNFHPLALTLNSFKFLVFSQVSSNNSFNSLDIYSFGLLICFLISNQSFQYSILSVSKDYPL